MATIRTVSAITMLDVHGVRAVVTSFRDAVRAHAPMLNLLNVYPVPDGDTGTNMARTLDAVVTELDGAPDVGDATYDAISHGSLMGARGNSGVILSQILRGVAQTMRGAPTVDARRFADALLAASDGAYRAVLTPVEGTILTVVRESAQAADAAARAGAGLVEVLTAARRAGHEALERTPDLLPVLRDAGVVDAGGAGFVLFLDAAMHVVAGAPMPVPPAVPESAVGTASTRPVRSGPDGDLGASGPRYEVMYLCQLSDDRIDTLKHTWGTLGDSIVVVGGDGLWNCHVHTDDIGAAIEAALDLDGRPSRIRVTDLHEEVEEEHAMREAALRASRPHPDVLDERCGIVAVASGAGLATLFRELGADQVVTGGQTANPSTAELLAAVERCGTTDVVVLPNNKNIVPVATQLDGLTEVRVRVVPTRTMPEGLAAMVSFEPDGDASANAEAMSASSEGVLTGEVTCAVRDTTSEVGPVREGQWIGLVRGDGLVAVADTVADVAMRLLDHLLAGERELVTVLTGADVDPEVTDRLVEWLADEHADVEVEVHDGGQPLYPYLFGIE